MHSIKYNVDNIYNELALDILYNGDVKGDRTGTGTTSKFGCQMRFDLSKGFPILSGKKVPLRLIASELLWFLKGETNIRPLLEENNNIWNEWGFEIWTKSEQFKEIFKEDFTNFGNRIHEDEEFKIVYLDAMAMYKENILKDEEFAKEFGELGSVYGKQWRSFEGANKVVDQIADVIEQIKTNPNSRRLIVNAWNPTEIEDMALPPCHLLFQFYVVNNKLSCQLYQRSGDYFLGIPFNISSYALLTHIIANECGLDVGEFIHTIGDAHIYNNHREQILLQTSRELKGMPTLVFPKDKKIEDFVTDDFKLIEYNPHPRIKGEVAV